MLTAVCAGFTVASAQAYSIRYWNSGGEPLTAFRYNSRAEAYGNFYISTGTDGTRARSAVSMKVTPGGENLAGYVEYQLLDSSGICFAPEYTSCSQSFYNDASGWTGNQRNNFWAVFPIYLRIDPTASSYRGKFRAKLDVAWRPDPWQESTTPAINY